MKSMMRSFLVVASLLVAVATCVSLSTLLPSRIAEAQPKGVQIYSETYDAASTADGAGITNAIAAPGAVLGDFCIASVSVDVVDMTITCNIQAAGSAEVRMQNESGSTVDLASATWRVMVFPHGTR